MDDFVCGRVGGHPVKDRENKTSFHLKHTQEDQVQLSVMASSARTQLAWDESNKTRLYCFPQTTPNGIKMKALTPL